MTPETFNFIVFMVLAVLAIGSAGGMLLSRNAVHSALFLVLNFAVVAVFFLILAAPFIAMVQITVYAGAIMVLFLFVIMLLGAEVLNEDDERLPWQSPLTLFLAGLLVGGLIFIFIGGTFLGQGAGPTPGIVEADFGSPQSVGLNLFQQYLLPFELTSFLLLAAMVGAVVLTRYDIRKRGR
jgi:NADH-quinone oxidoreductase subunit J